MSDENKRKKAGKAVAIAGGSTLGVAGIGAGVVYAAKKGKTPRIHSTSQGRRKAKIQVPQPDGVSLGTTKNILRTYKPEGLQLNRHKKTGSRNKGWSNVDDKNIRKLGTHVNNDGKGNVKVNVIRDSDKRRSLKKHIKQGKRGGFNSKTSQAIHEVGHASNKLGGTIIAEKPLIYVPATSGAEHVAKKRLQTQRTMKATMDEERRANKAGIEIIKEHGGSKKDVENFRNNQVNAFRTYRKRHGQKAILENRGKDVSDGKAPFRSIFKRKSSIEEKRRMLKNEKWGVGGIGFSYEDFLIHLNNQLDDVLSL